MKEFNINQSVRKNILELQPYISFRDHNEFENPVLMDANESPFGNFNRYPDSTQRKVKEKLASIKNISVDHIALGNGSDELIDLIIKIFCEPKKDSIMRMNPSFAMYDLYASINENKVVKLGLNKNFEIIKEDFLNLSQEERLKIFFLCSPNNPTGNSIDDLEFFIRNFSGIIVVDEAYIEFSGRTSSIELLDKYPNLIVLQTFSKAWGMAGARVGVAYASKEIIAFINTVKAPFNINSLSSDLILKALDNPEQLSQNVHSILSEKSWLQDCFKTIRCIKKVYPSEANFFLVEFENVEEVYDKLLEKEVLTSKRSPHIPDCIRINVGTREENEQLITVLQNIES
ncbi:histidinol-phosphate transaminase [Chryseobacterium sp. SSA4.19]|uniref:histidinol-phosphate transaminase n=1 Tax=Chryseobacterium sp. SSA4.19 TaxID=2919915 RepID=UPI001F4D7E3F|nr:histidinol-phosphate transaminase [Chryseobacterium sp. SSA4.19]MCJ8153505.1 histidinol-phosphate transaminase [Chryseobacterium sp. SSA4.19]